MSEIPTDPNIAAESEKRDITTEEAQGLTPLKLSEDAWKRFFSEDTPYDPNKVFYGVPGNDTEDGSGNIFKKVYDAEGKHQGGMITGIPQSELPK